MKTLWTPRSWTTLPARSVLFLTSAIPSVGLPAIQSNEIGRWWTNAMRTGFLHAGCCPSGAGR